MTALLTAMLVGTVAEVATVSRQDLQVSLDPAAHRARVVAELTVTSPGVLPLELTGAATDLVVLIGSKEATLTVPQDGDRSTIELRVPPGVTSVRVAYTGTFEEDVAAGEIPGQIHNFAVTAHVGEDGVFLSDGAAWHPRPLDARGWPQLHTIGVELEPLDGWSFVASGDPSPGAALDAPTWAWSTPRPVDGATLVGNRHVMQGIVHQTSEGPVEIVMHATPASQRLVPMYLDAARSYLDLYVPRLGAYPFRRFTIVENFFSSGFAFPGFTVLGPQVVAMAPRSLMPGFLDHELVHSWWGNGVYVSPADGNWCEALTSYCTNYFRRSVDGGEDALREYRRTTLMKLSADPDGLDDAPLGAFGSADPASGGASRFVGYDKGAFLFMMLESLPEIGGRAVAHPEDAGLWPGLKRFAAEYMGKRATWDDLRGVLEETYDVDLGPFWTHWVRQRTLPRTPESADELPAFQALAAPGQRVRIDRIESGDEAMLDVDPDFRFYRALPPAHTVPLIGGTTGPGGLRLVAPDRPEVDALARQLRLDPAGENLMLVGRDAVAAHANLIGRAADSIEFTETSFTVGGTLYNDPAFSMLHTMSHPDRPGRFITVFIANGPPGWAKLRLTPHYRRDTTVVWRDGDVLARRVHEPDRRLREDASSAEPR